ncbi:MAG: thiol:disulfide interchange protein DsbA/DsbL [Gammaproteobacteria bacterium]|nr:thiol:disulfide interchange protein DsbA/DsbL [Gammaproteobacteria bacterium]
MRKFLAIALLLLAANTANSANKYTAGFEYASINQQPTANADRVEVIEFFWYGCPHCFHFEPTLNRWLADKPENVDFIQIPAPLNKSWEIHTKVFYALELMGMQKKLHEKLFEAIHMKKMRLFDEKSITDFLVKQGVDREKFQKSLRSFAVSGKLNKARKMMKDYQVKGVPQLAINGKYITSGRMAGGYQQMIDVVNFLVAKESKK